MSAKCHSRYFILCLYIFCQDSDFVHIHGDIPPLCLWITISDTHTHRYIHAYTHTRTHICTAHGRRQAYTCRRICDYNQINWSISPWKHHIYTWRPLVAFSWMLLTLTRGQAAGARSAGSQLALWHQHLLYGLHVRKIITALTASFGLTEEEFLSVTLESSGLFKLHFLLVKFDTEKLFFFYINMKSWCCLAEASASSKTVAKHTWPLQRIV